MVLYLPVQGLCELQFDGVPGKGDMVLSQDTIRMPFTLSTEQFTAWTKSVSAYPREATVHSLFAERAAMHPGAPAVRDRRRKLSYGELNTAANRLAWRLLETGVRPGDRIGVAVERSVELIITELAILKAGGSYLPLDVLAPPQRLQLISADAALKVIVADSHLQSAVESLGAKILEVEEAAPGTKASDNPPECASATSVAYVLFTSGSTGVPKGVEVPHRAIVRLVRNTNYVELDEQTVVGQVAHAAFDAITFEVWGALLNGGQLVIVPQEVVLSPQRFAAAIRDEAITAMFLTASLFSVIASRAPAAFGGMRTLIVGGDAVDTGAARRVLATAPPRKLVNGYGPTECTTFAVCHDIRDLADDATTVPIGRPISNTEAYILDTDLRPVGVGVTGDLYLGGDGLALGYLNRPELTAERFVPHPFDATPGARIYRTGDRARYRPNGIIEFLGRIDHQVKFHGYRIELTEIEAALKQHPLVIDAVVTVWNRAENDQRLVAHVAGGESVSNLSDVHLRQHLEALLPPYMIPSHFVVMSELPLTAIGKVDRAALRQPVIAIAAATLARTADESELETKISQVWREVLSLDTVSPEQNFFEAGGTSITLALVEDRLRSFVTKPFTVTDLFRYPTIRSLSQFLQQDEREGAPLSDARARAARQRAALVSGGLRATRRF